MKYVPMYRIFLWALVALTIRQGQSFVPAPSTVVTPRGRVRLLSGSLARTSPARKRITPRGTPATDTCLSLSDSSIITVAPSLARRAAKHGATTFVADWQTYSLIPLIAAFVGWFTNYLAVQMIFYPIQWRGLPLYRVENQPLGFIGWQGIVPAKTKKMSLAMVNATLTQLLSMEEVVQRLDPSVVASILLPQAPAIIQPVVDEQTALMPTPLRIAVDKWMYYNQDYWQQDLARRFLVKLTVQFQERINALLNLRNCVVEQMMADRYVAYSLRAPSCIVATVGAPSCQLAISTYNLPILFLKYTDPCLGSCFRLRDERNSHS